MKQNNSSNFKSNKKNAKKYASKRRICWLKTNLWQEISCLKQYCLNENFS